MDNKIQKRNFSFSFSLSCFILTPCILFLKESDSKIIHKAGIMLAIKKLIC